MNLLQLVKKTLLLALVCAAVLPGFPASAAHTRDEVRAAYGEISDWSGESPYVRKPDVTAPYDAGELDAAATDDALAYLNFLRWLAGLEPVELSRIYSYQCQRGATLLAALDYVDHYAPRASGMDDNFYDSAHLATTSSNLARLNWMHAGILRDGVEYFVRDDGEENLAALGHRRWVLNPCMADTGFGLANSESGMSYIAMYAHDFGRTDVQWDSVCWPSEGAFPAELMHADLAWSVSLNPALYDVASSDVRVTLTETGSGMRFSFDCTDGQGDGFCTVDTGGYGAGPCIIFRPDFSGTDFTDYRQNQRWVVEITGLALCGGGETALQYAVDMVSLYVQDVVNLEISDLTAALLPGDTLTLSADVIPDYADDLTVRWRSTDPAVATVDEGGCVTAIAPGSCEIIAASANGREDRCMLTVTG